MDTIYLYEKKGDNTMAKDNHHDDYDEFESPGIQLLFGEITTEIAAQTIAWILTESINPNPPAFLTMLINSVGGDIAAAFAIIEVMQGSRIPIHTVGLGEISSAGLIIFMSGTPGHRVITPTCSVLSHTFSTGMMGNFHELVNVQKEFSFVNQRIVNQYVRCTGLDEQTVKDKLIPARDVFLSPTEAVELGLADEIRGLGSDLVM